MGQILPGSARTTEAVRRTVQHIDIAEVQTEEGKLYLFAAIDRTSKYAYTKAA